MSPMATVSDRHGPSWSGRLGDTVQVDWYDQTSGETHSERVAVLAVRRLSNPDDDDGPDEFGDGYGAYKWKYHGVEVRLASLHGATARTPVAYQFLSLSDGSYSEDSMGGLVGVRGGPARLASEGASSASLYQWADKEFTPTKGPHADRHVASQVVDWTDRGLRGCSGSKAIEGSWNGSRAESFAQKRIAGMRVALSVAALLALAAAGPADAGATRPPGPPERSTTSSSVTCTPTPAAPTAPPTPPPGTPSSSPSRRKRLHGLDQALLHLERLRGMDHGRVGSRKT